MQQRLATGFRRGVIFRHLVRPTILQSPLLFLPVQFPCNGSLRADRECELLVATQSATAYGLVHRSLPSSHQLFHVIDSLTSVSLSASRSSSLLTPNKAKGLSAYFFTSDRSCGYNSRQGPHQWPQKVNMTTLPR